MSVEIMLVVHNASPGIETMRLAAGWAGRLGGGVVGMGVVDESTAVPASVLAGGSASMGNITMADANALHTRAKTYVSEALRELEQHCRENKIKYRQMMTEDSPEEAICTEAQSCDVVLLGRETTPDLHFGVPARAILTRVLRHSPRPVVAIPGHVQGGQGILVAYDGSLQAARSVQALVASNMASLGPITVVGVHRHSEETARQNANRAVEYLSRYQPTVQSRIVVTNQGVECVILDEARARGVEMIVMGAYGHSRLVEFFIGSTTTKVMDAAPAPVFLFH